MNSSPQLQQLVMENKALVESMQTQLMAKTEQARIEREAMEDTFQKNRRKSRMCYVVYALLFFPAALFSPQFTIGITIFAFLLDTVVYYIIYTRREKMPHLSIAMCVVLGVRAIMFVNTFVIVPTIVLAAATFIAFKNPSLKLPQSIKDELKFFTQENFQTGIELKDTITSSRLAGKAKNIIHDAKEKLEGVPTNE